MGDACGIGPEIIAAWFRSADAGSAFVVGDIAVMRRAAAFTGGLLPVARIERAEDAATLPPDCMPVLQADGLAPDLIDAPLGRVDARAGAAAARCIEQRGRARRWPARLRRSSRRRSTRKRSLPPASAIRATPRCCRRSRPDRRPRRRRCA